MGRYLITSALPYINGIKHLGNLVGSMLPADIYARYLRQQGQEVLYICGTDEHGTPAELAAKAEGMSVEAYCQQMYERQSEIYQQFSIQFDYFGRSSSVANHEMTQRIFNELDTHGFIESREIEQVYSKQDERFLPDRYVCGTCPHCEYERARGDQCEACGRLLNTTDLVNPYSAISGSHDLEQRRSKHVFLKLADLADQVGYWVDQHPEWPTLTRGIAHKWLSEGLQTRCISRDLQWGVKIPKQGFEEKVFYVWFDAPLAYISFTQEWVEQQGDPGAWQAWWLPKDPETVTYLQFMAKDNVPFHSIFWPAMLLGTNERWKLADYIKSFNWLTYEGGKFSTSQQRGVFTDTALELFPADYWRYYLMAIAPESADSDFTFPQFAATVNKDLADTLGNFVSRVVALIKKYHDGAVPNYNYNPTGTAANEQLQRQVQEEIHKYDTHLRTLKFRQAMQALRAVWVIGNEYIAQQEPWKLIKTDLAAGTEVLANCLHLIRIYAILTAPILPDTSAKLWSVLGESGQPADTTFLESVAFNVLEPGQILQPCGNLFDKIPPEEAEALRERFAGTVI